MEIPRRYIHRPKKMSHPPSFNVSRSIWFDLCVGVLPRANQRVDLPTDFGAQTQSFSSSSFSPTERDFRERDQN